MRYVSTRGEAPELGFEDVLLTGLASDGGLYLPKVWPEFTPEAIASLAGLPYHAAAARVIAPFVGEDLDTATLGALCREAYGPERFRHAAVAPLVQLDANLFVLELFHGPTLAFKDVAMQLLARLMDHALEKRNGRVTIVGATSGDTGGAAIEAFRGRERADVFILYPHGRVSDVQRLQMTTPTEANVHAIAVEGTFDDCQALVKAMFANRPFNARVGLSAVNSINWARILAQVVYYVTAAVALGAPHRAMRFVVPTGNFGNVFAGWVARRMGLPVDRFVIATNVNDILARTVQTGRYEVRGVTPSTSPSMDIQVSSNFERLLAEVDQRDAVAVRRQMSGLAQSGAFAVSEAAMARLRADFTAASADDAATAAEMRHWWHGRRDFGGYLADPHTATALKAARTDDGLACVPRIALATAHPAKFPDAVEAAVGERPGLPDWLSFDAGRERFTILPADQARIEGFILERARAARG
jgi:threonine synthase